MRVNKSYLLSVLLISLLLIGIDSDALVAQTQKTGYVASEAIFNNLPDSKAARTKLTEMQTGWMREIERMESDIRKLAGEIENNRLIWSAQEKQDAEARLADMTAKLAEFRATTYGPNGEFEKQQATLMGPVYDKVMSAIMDEAKAQKIDFVLDKSSRGLPLLYSNPQYDLTIAVLKRLGVDVDSSAVAPLAPSTIGTQSPEDAVRNRTRRDDQPAIQIDPNALLKGEGKPIDVNLPSLPTLPVEEETEKKPEETKPN